jgi:phosphonate transport system substrate-binding protein
MIELNPDIKNKTTILAEYPIKSKNFSYFRKDYPLIDQLTKAAMAFPDNPRARQILEVFKTPDIDYCKVEELDSFDKFYKSYLQLKLHVKK